MNFRWEPSHGCTEGMEQGNIIGKIGCTIVNCLHTWLLFERKIANLPTLKETWKIGSNIPIYIISDVTKATGHDFSFTPNCAIYARLGPSDTSWNIICIYRYYSLCLDENFAPIISELTRGRWRWSRANYHSKKFLKENLTNLFLN